MNDTPETDVAEYYIQGEGNYVRSDISRKLERERGEANTKLQDVSSKLADALRERDAARGERDKLKQLLAADSENVDAYLGVCIERDEAESVADGLAEQAERLRKERDEARHEIEGWSNKWNIAVEMAARAEVERYEIIKKLEEILNKQ
jgi:hypothetical protein